MATFLLRRLLAGFVTLWAVATFTFLLTRFAPGSPFTTERQVDPVVRRAQERRYGLDRPLPEQYWKVMSGYLKGDLGPSFLYTGRTVSELILPAFAVSTRLGAIAFVLALAAGTILGVLAAAHQNRWPDHLAMSIATAGICVPNFLLGPLLVLAFAFLLPWLPPTGWPQDWTSWSELKLLILPAITLALVHVAYVSRLTRAGMLDVLHRDFIRTARAKGLTETAVVLKHGLKNGITPALTYAGPMAAFLITGSLVVEKVFNIPGLGTHFVNSALSRDYGIISGAVLLYGSMIILFNILIDVLYGVLDPRVRLG